MHCNKNENPNSNKNDTQNNPTSMPIIYVSSEGLDADYETCPSCERSSDQYVVSNQSITPKYHRRPRTYQMTINKMPIDHFHRSTTSYKNLPNFFSRSSKRLKSTTPCLSSWQSSYRVKLKRPRREITLMTHECEKFRAETHSTHTHFKKLNGKSTKAEEVLAGKISHKNDKRMNVNKIKNVADEEWSTSQLNLPKTDVNIKPEKVDIYYFDHGNSEYYLTTDIMPILLSDKCADSIDNASTRFWAEIFGTFHIGMQFIIAFLLQLLRFIFRSIIRPLIIGVIQMIADYVFKPTLTIIYNGIIQPMIIFLYNIATSFRDLCEPIAEAMGYFLNQLANLFRAIRMVEINSQDVTNNHRRSINEPT